MSFVLDASVALAWCFHDESTPKLFDLLERLEVETGIAQFIAFSCPCP